MAKQDYYELLGINKGASDGEIKSAYRAMAKKYHPDANPNDKTAEAKFKEVGEAYSVLSDSQKKAAYDQYGHSAFEQGGGAHGFNFNMDFDAHDIFGNIFGDFFGGGRSRQPQGPRRGSDLQTEVYINFEESITGAERELNLPLDDHCATCKGSGAKPGTVAESCKRCNGTGQERVVQQTMFGAMQSARTCGTCRGSGKIIKEPCSTCKGSGIVRKNEKIQITIPKGIDNGQAVRKQGMGQPGQKGGPKGDLLIVVNVRPHKQFKRQGNNLYLDLGIEFTQAALGGDITIPTPYGDIPQQIKAGTQPNTVVTIKGKGVPNVRNEKQVGDLFVKLNIKVPTSLTQNQKDLLTQFAGDLPPGETTEKKRFFGKKK